MPTKKKPRITSWSYSRWSCYNECPLKAKFKFIDKVEEPETPALLNGKNIHKLAEDFVSGKIKALPKELILFEKEFLNLKRINRRVAVEQELAFTEKWVVCDWFDSATWLRVKVDALYQVKATKRLVIIDYKTGKVREENVLQLDIYALAGFLAYDVDVVEAAFWYLDEGEERSKVYKKEELKNLQNVWFDRSRAMLSDTTFDAKAGNHCRWCFFAKAKKGLCKY